MAPVFPARPPNLPILPSSDRRLAHTNLRLVPIRGSARLFSVLAATKSCAHSQLPTLPLFAEISALSLQPLPFATRQIRPTATRRLPAAAANTRPAANPSSKCFASLHCRIPRAQSAHARQFPPPDPPPQKYRHIRALSEHAIVDLQPISLLLREQSRKWIPSRPAPAPN